MINGVPSPFKNVGDDDIPPYGVMEICGADVSQSSQNSSRVELHARQIGSERSEGSYASDGPDYLWQRSLAFNGPARIEEDKRGEAQPIGHVYYAGVTLPAWDLESATDKRNMLPVYAMRNRPYLTPLAWNTPTATIINHPNALLDPVQGIADYLVSEWRILKVLRAIPGQSAKLCLVQPIENRIHHGWSLNEIEAYKYGYARFNIAERTAYTLASLDTIQLQDPGVRLPVLNYMPDESIATESFLHITLLDGVYAIINAEC